MKRVFTSGIFCLIFIGLYAGYNPGTIKWQNKTRKYTIYVPDIYYSAGKPVPLLLGLHGFGDNIDNFSHICLTGIADTANYIAVYAEGWPDALLGSNSWNSGASLLGVPFNNGIDDVGFLNAVLDTVIANYNIDTTRMYVFGFSFGAFMTNRMASECTNRFAAVAAVSGLRGNMLTAIPAHEMPIVYFHGTNDQTINFYTCPYGLNATNTLNFWVKNNHCDSIPASVDTLPDLANDAIRVVRFVYANGTNGSRVDFYKEIGAGHEWLGLPSNDISTCQTIWSFFRQFTKKTSVATGIHTKTATEKIELYPNPSQNSVYFKLPANTKNEIRIGVYTPSGADVSGLVKASFDHIAIDGLEKGIYFISIQTGDATFSGSFVKQ